MATNMIKTILTIIAIILAIDFLAFVLWILSNQVPPDGFYIGAITSNLLKLILI